MDPNRDRRKRLGQLLSLARAYRGWSRKELAEALRRDPTTRLVPGSGIPKMDLVVELAGVLDWSVGDVVAFLWGKQDKPAGAAGAAGTAEVGDAEELQLASKDAQRRGEYALALALAQQGFIAGETAEQRAWACVRESVAWDGLGHYTDALEAAQRGLEEPSISAVLRRILVSNLANAYYTLWALTEARSLAADLIDGYRDAKPESSWDRSTYAFAYYVRGHTLRRMMMTEPERIEQHARDAIDDLELASRLHLQLAKDKDDDALAAIANTCRGGIVEAEAVLGRRDPERALEELADGLKALADPSSYPVGDWLESYGWWCIFGCNIAMRHIADRRELHRQIDLFTSKAEPIANRLDNWALRERIFIVQHAIHEHFLDWTGREIPLTLDAHDLRALVGTMGRFPRFRETGRRLLERATLVGVN